MGKQPADGMHEKSPCESWDQRQLLGEILTEVPEVIGQPVDSTFLYHPCSTK